MKTPTKQDIKGSYITPDGKAQIDFEVTYRNGYPEFTASGHFEGSGGQCRDLIRDAYGSKLSCGDFHDLLYLWRDYHLKSLDGANPAVLRTLKAWSSRYPFRNYYHAQADQFLTSNGLKLRATLSDSKTPAWDDYQPMKKCEKCKGLGCFRSFPFGTPQTVWQSRQTPPQNVPIYTKCDVCKGEKEVPDLEARKHGHHYRVTISRGKSPRPICSGTTLKPDRFTFDFWGSIADAQSGKHPHAYDILACISSDAHTPETFEGWCSEYGESTDSLKALQTFRRCSTFAKRLRAFFTPAELEQLAAIQ